MKASELPSDIRKSLLEDIENKLGYSEYRKMVDALGEDGMLDMVLENMEKKATEEKEKKDAHTGCVIWVIIFLILFIIGGCVEVKDLKQGQDSVSAFLKGGAGVAVPFMSYYICEFILHILGKICSLIIDNTGIILRCIIFAVLIAGLAVGMWYAVPWIWHGVVDWWKWLSGHFS
jgi:hypothetical protein